MFVDFVLNGEGHGPVGEAYGDVRFDPGVMRPYYNSRHEKCVTVNTGRTRYDKDKGLWVPVYEEHRIKDLIANDIYSPVFNATTLRKEEWVRFDTAVVTAARRRLRAWADLAASSTYGGFDGMATTVLEHETMSDPGDAKIDMDAIADETTDSPLYQREGLPLPIIHAGFWFSARRLAISRKLGNPLSTVMAESAGRRIAEKIEKLTIGVQLAGITARDASNYGRSPQIYGYTNFPARITKTNMTAPTGANGTNVLTSWLQLRDLLYAKNFYGPFMVYVSNDWDAYLDNLFSTSEPSAGTLRSRLKQIDGIRDIRRLDYLTNTFTVLMVQMTSDVAQAVVGMDINTVQWESQGGTKLNFKAMAIYAPRLRADYYGNCGVAHGTTS